MSETSGEIAEIEVDVHDRGALVEEQVDGSVVGAEMSADEQLDQGVRASNRALVAASLTALALREKLIPESKQKWQEKAGCLGVDPDLFFPERGASTREAKAVCRGCEVRMECLEYALANGEKSGIWGGLTERERRRVRRQRALERRNALSS